MGQVPQSGVANSRPYTQVLSEYQAAGQYRSCNQGGTACISPNRCPISGRVSPRQCPANEVCCRNIATLPPTTLSPCTGTGLGCVSTCNTLVIPRSCPGALMCCIDPSG
ncbi:uncharacterized protein LOC124277748 [Haliotis rubra]|uniref:uncharacterized protein LOC124277748 n=1 Tax=Haliotis rubra TaxID=36100 RepID=UPI001EE55950|nr:uncharacterized protein LOC124277748 [Haliotis rubra]